jgi:hypothetical protein
MSKKSRFTISSALALGAIGLAIGAYSLFSGQGAVEAQNGNVSTSSTYRFSDASMVDGGSATLVRDKNGLTATFQTSDLNEGHAYTMWWVIFNNPENCEHGMPGMSNCGEGDVFAEPLGETPVKVSVQFAAGNVIGDTGMGNFGAHLDEGHLPTETGQLVFGPGLYDSKKSEVHLVVRDHGPVIPEMEYAQITTFGGACTSDTDPSQVGPVGPNSCQDRQFAIFMP